jgi:zinc/manganese transport system substrate-binding protein
LTISIVIVNLGSDTDEEDAVRRRGWAIGSVALATTLVAAACSTSPGGTTDPGQGRVLPVAASINAWGSILAQLGGRHVHETSIITNPDTDPHSYEPTVADSRTIAESRLFVENGIGYDSWAARSLAASPDSSRLVIDVGDVVHVPDGGNPHRWYSPADVEAVADTITADLKKLDPADAAYFDQRRAAFRTTALAEYHRLISEIRSRYAGTPVGASESIFAPLASALGLNLLTPPSFLKAISEGTDPSPQDKATIDVQIAERKIKVYVYNSQNATPDVQAQVKAARAQGIPVTAITETLSPATATFQQWQSAQLQALARALTEATGR